MKRCTRIGTSSFGSNRARETWFVINSGSKVLQLYSLYAPPEHKEGTIHATKAGEKEEHFDGRTTE